MRDLAGDLRHLSINTATLRKQLALPAIIEACAARGIGAVCPWRDQVQAASLAAVARQIEDSDLAVSGYCRGGFFPAADAAGLLRDPDMARRRMVRVLAVHGIA